MSETMQLWWIATFGALIYNSFVAGLQSEGSEFYIPFWFNSPEDGSDSTILYLSTFESEPVTVNVSLNVQNRSEILTHFYKIAVSPSNVSVIQIKEWLLPDLPEAANRVPDPDNESESDDDIRWKWWVVNYIHILTAKEMKITVHVRASINNALYTYTPFPVDKYANSGRNNYEYYIIQEPTPTDCSGCEESSYLPMVVIISPFYDTNISTKTELDSYLQLLATNLTREDEPDDLLFQSSEVKYRIQQFTPQISIFTPSSATTKTYSKMKVNATKPILVFSGRALPDDKRGFLIHQQIPPTIEWGKTFVSFPKISDSSSTQSPKHHYFFLASSALMTEVTYNRYRKRAKYRHVLTVTDEHTVDSLSELYFFYYVLQSDRKMWAVQGSQVGDNLTFLAIPSVEHYANRYKFPAAGKETDLKTTVIKLVIPAQYFQLEQIFLDDSALQDLKPSKTKTLVFEDNCTYHLREYYVDKNYRTGLNNSNMHQIYHKNSSAVFGLVIAGKIQVCKESWRIGFESDLKNACHDHIFAFPAGFNGTGAEVLSTEKPSAEPESDINKISPAIVVAILLGIMAVTVAFVFVIRSAIKRRRKNAFAHHRLSMPMFEMREPDAANCEYDIFISFAEEDHSFVEEQLFHPLEERGFQVCWHHRDFLPGYSIIENIKNSIDRSRRVILVFSEHFHKSEYCMFELRYSCDKMLSTHSQMLIPIVLHEDSFPRELDHITYWGFSAEHPEENNLPALAESLGTPIARESREALDEMAFQESNVLNML